MMNLKKVLIGSLVSILISIIRQVIVIDMDNLNPLLVAFMICDALTFLLIGVAVSIVASKFNRSIIAIAGIVSIAVVVTALLNPFMAAPPSQYMYWFEISGLGSLLDQYVVFRGIGSFILGFGVGYLLTRIHPARLSSARR